MYQKVKKKSKFCFPIISSDEKKVQVNKVLLYFMIMNEELSLFGKSIRLYKEFEKRYSQLTQRKESSGTSLGTQKSHKPKSYFL